MEKSKESPLINAETAKLLKDNKLGRTKYENGRYMYSSWDNLSDCKPRDYPFYVEIYYHKDYFYDLTTDELVVEKFFSTPDEVILVTNEIDMDNINRGFSYYKADFYYAHKKEVVQRYIHIYSASLGINLPEDNDILSNLKLILNKK